MTTVTYTTTLPYDQAYNEVVTGLIARGAIIDQKEPTLITGRIIWHKRPSIVVGLILCLFFLIPGILYFALAGKDRTDTFVVEIGQNPGEPTTTRFNAGGKASYQVQRTMEPAPVSVIKWAYCYGTLEADEYDTLEDAVQSAGRAFDNGHESLFGIELADGTMLEWAAVVHMYDATQEPYEPMTIPPWRLEVLTPDGKEWGRVMLGEKEALDIEAERWRRLVAPERVRIVKHPFDWSH